MPKNSLETIPANIPATRLIIVIKEYYYTLILPYLIYLAPKITRKNFVPHG
jgi:hypothetical protein